VELEEIKQRLEYLEDLEAIKQLQTAYVNCLTFAKWDELLDCFDDDITLDTGQGSGQGNITVGKDRLGKLFKEKMSQIHVGKEGNFLVQPVISVNGDRATGNWLIYMMNVHEIKTNQWLNWVQGIYDCEYVRINGKWKIRYIKWRARLKNIASQIQLIL
jgi:hypothetical protein